MSGHKTLAQMRAHMVRQRSRRAALRDPSLPAARASAAKRARADLGLELLMRRARFGAPLSYDDIACWCGITPAAVFMMQQSAIKKLANRLRFGPLAPLFREYLAA